MKLEDFVSNPVRLDLTSTDSPLPTIKDVLGHFHCLMNETKSCKGQWSTNELYYKIAADLITLYNNRSMPTIDYRRIVE